MASNDEHEKILFLPVNNHPHRGWLALTLKGRKQKTQSVKVAFFMEPSPWVMIP